MSVNIGTFAGPMHAGRHAADGADPVTAAAIGASPLASTGRHTLTGSYYVDGYGAKGDGSTIDTAAIQSAVNDALANSGVLIFTPGKNYKIDAAIKMGNVSGGTTRWLIQGNGATITQASDNTPIFWFTKEGTYLWRVEGFKLTYTNQQPSSNTSAIGFYFDSDTNNNFGFYNFEIRNIQFGSCFRGIALNEGSANTNPVWGGDIHNIQSSSTVSGAVVRLRQVASGQPNMTLRQIYVRGDVGTETLLDMQGYQGLVIQNVEFNNTVGAELLLTTCNAVTVDCIRTESGSFAASFAGLWTFSDVRGRIGSMHVQSKTFSPGASNWAYICRCIGTSTYMAFGNATVQSLTVSTGAVALIQGDNVADLAVDGGFLNGSSITKFYPFDNTGTHVSRDRGVRGSVITKTANYTLTNTDDIVLFNGASLTCTLPSASSSALALNRQFTIKNINSSTLTVSGTIDGSANPTLAQNAVLRVITNGTSWYSI